MYNDWTNNKPCVKKFFIFLFQILRINTKYNILYLLGNCPGKKGSFITIQDSYKPHEHPPPFPTYFPDPQDPLPEDMFADDVQQFDETIFFTKQDQANEAAQENAWRYTTIVYWWFTKSMCGFHSEGRKKQHLVTAIKNDTSMDEKKLQVFKFGERQSHRICFSSKKENLEANYRCLSEM